MVLMLVAVVSMAATPEADASALSNSGELCVSRLERGEVAGPEKGHHLRVQVRGGDRALVEVTDRHGAWLGGLDTAKPVVVSVLVRGKPYESFTLDFAGAGASRLTLRRNGYGYFELRPTKGICQWRAAKQPH